jgi:outer membrane protein OmpA-like peptidoglycan-associated protein
MKMKKGFTIAFAVLIIAAIAACKSAPKPPADLVNPEIGPEVKVVIPELFSPSPDIVDDTITISIEVKHVVPVRDWAIQIQPNRAQTAAAQAAPAEGEQPRRQRNRRVFFEVTGKGNPPNEWKWNGKGTSGEMVQSATDYRFTLSVDDVFGNKSTFEGIISVDVLVKREGDNLRIIVPSIVFPPNSSDFSRLSQDDTRANTRVLRLIANSLNKYPDYKITVEGHANPTTRPNTKDRTTEEDGTSTIIGLKPLSEDRAKAVVEFLVTNNSINRQRLTAVGLGGTRTVAAYNDDEENWKNRRVEFILHR